VAAIFAPLLVAGFIVVFDNGALWHALSATYPSTVPWVALCTAALALSALLAAALQLVNLRGLFKPVAVLLLLISATTAHFMDSYGVILDDEMFRNVLQTDRRERVSS
jgi:lipid A ethanolaminephosphotransferase